jgi:hypothetical protein
VLEIVGSYLTVMIFGVDIFSIWTIIGGIIGGFLGVWLGVVVAKKFDGY